MFVQIEIGMEIEMKMEEAVVANLHPVKVIAFDLDTTLVRTISLHTPDQPQPEQFADIKEYHHVYKRPYLAELLAFLRRAVPSDPAQPGYVR